MTLPPRERERLASLQRLLQDVVKLASPAGLDEILSRGLEPGDAAVLARTDPRRLLVYRKLVRGTLRDAVRRQIPRAAETLGTSAFERYAALFCDEELPRSPILRDVAYELCAWAEPRWRADARLPAHLADLARYELCEFDVYTSPSRPHPEEQPLEAHRAVAFDDTVRLARFSHAVHRLEDDREPAAREPTALLLYRDGEGEIARMELTAAASTLLARLLVEGEPLAGSVEHASLRHGEALDARMIESTAQLLADLAERGVVLGPRDPGPLEEPPSPFLSWLSGPDPWP
jgi:hypothetical protein